MWFLAGRCVSTFVISASLLLLSGLGSIAQAANPNTVMLVAIGQVTELQGNVKALGVNHQVRVLKENSPLFPKDTIITDGQSYAGLRFTDGTLAVLRPDTSLKINTYQFSYSRDPDATLSPQDHFKMILAKGGMDLNAGRIARGNPDAFQITTPVGSLTLSKPSANIAFQTDAGMAFKGSGTLKNFKGAQKVVEDDAAVLKSAASNPGGVFLTPTILTDATEKLASQILQHQIVQYGENSIYQEIATSQVQTTEDFLSQEEPVNALDPNANKKIIADAQATKAKPDDDSADDENAKPDDDNDKDTSAKADDDTDHDTDAKADDDSSHDENADSYDDSTHDENAKTDDKLNHDQSAKSDDNSNSDENAKPDDNSKPDDSAKADDSSNQNNQTPDDGNHDASTKTDTNTEYTDTATHDPSGDTDNPDNANKTEPGNNTDEGIDY